MSLCSPTSLLQDGRRNSTRRHLPPEDAGPIGGAKREWPRAGKNAHGLGGLLRARIPMPRSQKAQPPVT